jgi:hypothetical protein
MSVRWSGLRARVMCASAAFVLLSTACGAFEESPPKPTPAPTAANLLVDPGFELGTGWTARSLFLDTEHAHYGARSLGLFVNGPPGTGDAAMQSVVTAELPEFLSGFYLVDDWPAGGAYLQFTVRAATGRYAVVPEVRFIIAGTGSEAAPSSLTPAVFLSRHAPATGEWTYFAYPLRQAFLDKTAAIPATSGSVDVSLELWSLSGGVQTTAFFDDIYLGPQTGNPNRPKQSTR